MIADEIEWNWAKSSEEENKMWIILGLIESSFICIYEVFTLLLCSGCIFYFVLVTTPCSRSGYVQENITVWLEIPVPVAEIMDWDIWRPVTNSRRSSEDIQRCDISRLAVITHLCRRQCGKIDDGGKSARRDWTRAGGESLLDVCDEPCFYFWLLSWRLLDGWIKHELIFCESSSDGSQPDEPAVNDYELWLDNQCSGFTERSIEFLKFFFFMISNPSCCTLNFKLGYIFDAKMFFFSVRYFYFETES